MPSNLTKSAVLIAMRIAESEGDRPAWHVLDAPYASLVTGDTLTLAAAAISVVREALPRLDPYDLDHGDAGVEDAVIPAWATASDGRRS